MKQEKETIYQTKKKLTSSKFNWFICNNMNIGQQKKGEGGNQKYSTDNKIIELKSRSSGTKSTFIEQYIKIRFKILLLQQQQQYYRIQSVKKILVDDSFPPIASWHTHF